MKSMVSAWWVTLLAGSALVAPPAFAQDRPASEEDEVTADIVVTAQRREERLQDVPVAVSVVSGQTLEARGGINIENAQYLVPSLNFRKSGVAINQSLFLRGVGTSTFSLAGEPSVSTVVDGVVFSRAGEAFSDLVDIERIEVLRGPQGTLFGKNASAGVVNIVSRQPTDQFEGYGEAGYFEGDDWRVRGAINLPLAPGVAFRGTGFYSSFDGNIRNDAANPDSDFGDRVNGWQRWGLRGTLKAELSPAVTLTVIGDYRESDDDCCGEVIGGPPLNGDGTVNAAVLGYLQPALPALEGDETRTMRQNVITRSIQKSWGGSVQLDAVLNDVTFTSITAYRNFDEREIRDGDFLGQGFADLVSGARLNLQDSRDDGPQTGETFSQELRLTSPGGRFLDYVVGLFYSRAETERTFTRNVVLCDITPRPATLTACGQPGAGPIRAFSGTATFGSVFKNVAAYGQATLNLSDRLRLIGGLRYTIDQVDVFHSRVGTPAPGINGNFDAGVFNNGLTTTNASGQTVFVPGASNGVPYRARTDAENLSGKAAVQFDVSDQVTAYASYTRGYKGPAFNTFFNLTTPGAGPIEPETVDSFEGGLKNTLFGGRLILNLAAFYAQYDNFQANNPDIVAGVLVTRFTNAGTVSTRGAELDLLWRPARDVSLSGGVAYTRARVDEFRQPTSGVNTGIIPSGTVLGFAPEWKGSLAGDWRIRTGGPIDIALNAQGSYQSSQLSQFDANPVVRDATTIDGYALVNLSAGIVDARDRFRVTVQVNNVFDQSFAASITSGGPGGTYRYIIPREADRYVGIVGRVNF